MVMEFINHLIRRNRIIDTRPETREKEPIRVQTIEEKVPGYKKDKTAPDIRLPHLKHIFMLRLQEHIREHMDLATKLYITIEYFKIPHLVNHSNFQLELNRIYLKYKLMIERNPYFKKNMESVRNLIEKIKRRLIEYNIDNDANISEILLDINDRYDRYNDEEEILDVVMDDFLKKKGLSRKIKPFLQRVTDAYNNNDIPALNKLYEEASALRIAGNTDIYPEHINRIIVVLNRINSAKARNNINDANRLQNQLPRFLEEIKF